MSASESVICLLRGLHTSECSTLVLASISRERLLSDFISDGFIEAKRVYVALKNVCIACLFYLGKIENNYWCGRQAALTSFMLAPALQSDNFFSGQRARTRKHSISQSYSAYLMLTIETNQQNQSRSCLKRSTPHLVTFSDSARAVCTVQSHT